MKFPKNTIIPDNKSDRPNMDRRSQNCLPKPCTLSVDAQTLTPLHTRQKSSYTRNPKGSSKTAF